MTPERIERARSNLRKVSLFQALIAVLLIYAGWFATSTDLASGVIMAVRIGAIAVAYTALKCWLIRRYMNCDGS